MNYYQAYMIMLFLGFFWLSRLIIDKKYFRSAGDLLLCVINSVMLAFFSLLPTVISLRGEKSMSEADFGLFRKFSFLNFFSGFYSGSTRNDLLPQVYCSVAAVMLMIVFFISKKIGLREKAADLFLLAILTVSMCINIIDAVWHGFNNPVGFPWRYSYVLSLTIVIIAYRGFLNGMKKLSVTVVGIISMLFLIACFASGSPFIDRERFIINLFLIAMVTVCLLLFLSAKGRVRGFILGLLMFVSFSDMVYNTFVIYRYMNFQVDDEEKDHISEFEDAYDEMKEAIDMVKESDRGFYRLEKTFQYAPNDTMLFDYMGLSHSSSCEKSDVRHFMQRMGFRDTGLYAFYAGGSTAFADSFLGVKYLISQWDSLDKDYEPVADTDKYYIFKNNNALPLAFLTDKDIGAVDAESGITFELQNEIAKASGGAQIFKEAEPCNISLENAEAAGDGVYRKKGDERAFVVYDIDISEEMPLYMYFDSDGLNRSEIFVNDVSKDLYFTETHWNVLCAGRFKKGDRIRIKAEILGDELNISRAGFYYEDMNALDAWHEAVAEDNKENSRIERLSSSHLKFNVSAKEEKTLVMTLPYDKGWHIRVDGKKVDSERILDVLTGVSISKGEHEIEMQYIPQGLIPGLIITLLGIVLLIIKSRPAKSRAAV